MKKRLPNVILAIVLSIALVYPLTSPAIEAYAEGIPDGQEESFEATEDTFESILEEPDGPVTEPELPTEPPPPEAREPELTESPADSLDLVSIEDEFTVTYREADGTFSTWFSESRLAYEDEDGELRLFDNTLEEQNPDSENPYYENAGADYTAVFPDTITEEEGVSLEKDGNKIEMIPLEGDFSISLVKDNAIRYTEALPGIDYQYTLFGDVIKEDIILNNHVDSPSFEFELKLNGLTARLENNIVCVYAGGEKEPVFTLSAPVMTDSSGASSTEIEQGLRIENGKTILTVTPDTEWLNDLNRAYPVKIDPTLTIRDNRLYLTMVSNVSPNSHNNDAQNGGGALVGYDDGIRSGSAPWPFLMTRLYAKLNYNLAAIPKEARLCTSPIVRALICLCP